jgi:hypothetical protein
MKATTYICWYVALLTRVYNSFPAFSQSFQIKLFHLNTTKKILLVVVWNR